jgi:hypothetical protein
MTWKQSLSPEKPGSPMLGNGPVYGLFGRETSDILHSVFMALVL